jgi:hypothetical protein
MGAQQLAPLLQELALHFGIGANIAAYVQTIGSVRLQAFEASQLCFTLWTKLLVKILKKPHSWSQVFGVRTLSRVGHQTKHPRKMK